VVRRGCFHRNAAVDMVAMTHSHWASPA
jgi:hypothetical protein